MSIGILSFGSLIRDPGRELAPVIINRIGCQTPFPVEFGRLSIGRGGGPTVVPYHSGRAVDGVVLELDPNVTLKQATNMLYRRERRKEGDLREVYNPREKDPNRVIISKWIRSWVGVDTVIYTDFAPTGKIKVADPTRLACAAILSMARARPGMDGISYLQQIEASGVETELMPDYKEAILDLTDATSLDAAKAKLNPTCSLLARCYQQLWSA